MTPQLRQRLRQRPTRCLVALLVGVASLSPALASRSASASPIDDKRAEAQRIASKLDQLGNRISQLDEQYNAARLRVERVQGQVNQAEQKAAATQQRYQQARDRARDRAVAAYIDGGSTTRVARVMSGGDGRDVLLRNQYLAVAASDDQAAIDELTAAREDLDTQQKALAREQSAARAGAAQVSAARQQTASAAAEEQALLRRVQGELSQLVAAEQARQQAAAQAAARARIEAAQARAAASGEAASGRRGTPRASRSRPSPDSFDAPPGTDAPAPSSGAGAAVAFAKSQLGKPYQWGGDGPDSYDCSGLTMRAWQQGGVSLPHSSSAQYSATTHVPLSQVQPGDLLFYGSPIHHVGIYVGSGQMIEAPHSGTNVRYAGIYRSDLVGVGRPG